MARNTRFPVQWKPLNIISVERAKVSQVLSLTKAKTYCPWKRQDLLYVCWCFCHTGSVPHLVFPCFTDLSGFDDFQYRISNIQYNVSSGDRNPVPDRSAPLYITVGDGGNQEGLAGRFRDPQPDYSAFREASYGHSTLEIKNRTHAFYHWNRNDDGKKVETDSFILHNQYWVSSFRRRKLKKHRS